MLSVQIPLNIAIASIGLFSIVQKRFRMSYVYPNHFSEVQVWHKEK